MLGLNYSIGVEILHCSMGLCIKHSKKKKKKQWHLLIKLL